MRHKVIMDCDTGRDDALAIALALAAPDHIDLLGITAVAGNIPLHLTERNARFICELCGRSDIKVFAGADRPLMRPLQTAENAHGESGLAGIEVEESRLKLQAGHAVDFIIGTLRAAEDDSITLVPTGPLTNIALVCLKAPELLPKVKQIVLMGGARTAGGNVTPAAEFNIFVDPHAAKLVFGCGRPIVAFGLDATYRVLASAEQSRRLTASGRKVALKLAPLCDPMPSYVEPISTWGEGDGITGVLPMHDPCTIAWLIAPELFKLKHVNVDVETAGELTLGATVVDFWRLTKRAPNTFWAYDADGPAVLDLITSRICRL